MLGILLTVKAQPTETDPNIAGRLKPFGEIRPDLLTVYARLIPLSYSPGASGKNKV